MGDCAVLDVADCVLELGISLLGGDSTSSSKSVLFGSGGGGIKISLVVSWAQRSLLCVRVYW